MAEKGLLIVISGPAGSGKGKVTEILTEKYGFVKSVSITTRAPRPGEVAGRDYNYISHEEFKERIKKRDTMEHAKYCGNYYGTPKSEAENVIESGKHLILEIEVQGAMKIKKKRKDAILIMLLPPSHSKQEERLRGRGTETEESVINRLNKAKIEITYLPRYDYSVINEDGGVEQCAELIYSIMQAEHARTVHTSHIIKEFE